MGFRQAVAVAVAAFVPLVQAENAGNLEGEVELGVLVTSGNSEETKINGRLALAHEIEHWRNSGELSSRYSEAEGTTTTEEYRASAETDYKFSERQYWFVRGSYEDDRFSGYDFESSLTAGYGHRVWESGERSFLDLSVGAGYRYNRLEIPNARGEQAEDEAIARLAGHFDYALSENALFRQKLSSEYGLDDDNAVTESETSLQASVVGNLSLKAAFRIKHVSEPPEGAETTDTETSLSLLYGF